MRGKDALVAVLCILLVGLGGLAWHEHSSKLDLQVSLAAEEQRSERLSTEAAKLREQADALVGKADAERKLRAQREVRLSALEARLAALGSPAAPGPAVAPLPTDPGEELLVLRDLALEYRTKIDSLELELGEMREAYALAVASGKADAEAARVAREALSVAAGKLKSEWWKGARVGGEAGAGAVLLVVLLTL